MDLSQYYAEIEARAQSDIRQDMEEKVDAYLRTVNP
jgi:conjugal transfer mating pair stabilization protein TraN